DSGRLAPRGAHAPGRHQFARGCAGPQREPSASERGARRGRGAGRAARGVAATRSRGGGAVSPARDPLDLVRVDAARLEAAIASSGLSARDLAQLAGVNPSNLSRVRRPGSAIWGTIQLLAEVLGVDPAALLAEPESDEPPP